MSSRSIGRFLTSKMPVYKKPEIKGIISIGGRIFRMEITDDESGASMNEVIASSAKGGPSAKGGKPAPLTEAKTLDLGIYLYVEIEHCKDLIKADYFGQSDAFVIMKLDDIEIARTSVVNDSTEPEWHDECYELPADILRNAGGERNVTITFEVWDMDTMDVGDFLGGVSYHCSDFGDLGGPIVSVEKPLKKLTNPNGLALETPKNRPESAFFQRIATEQEEGIKTIAEGVDEEDVETGVTAPSATDRWAVLKKQVASSKEAVQDYKVSNADTTRREHKSRLEYDEFKSSQKTTIVSTSIILFYLFIGVISFSFLFEQWTVVDSLYFSVVTFTTVGYGDLFPGVEYPGGCVNNNAAALAANSTVEFIDGCTAKRENDDPKLVASQIFACFFSLLGIAIIGYALQILGQQFVQAQVKAMQAAQASAPEKLEDDENDPNKLLEADTDDEREKKLIARAIKCLWQDDAVTKAKEEAERAERTSKIMKLFIPVVVTIFSGALVFGIVEGWGVLPSIYWCVITAASVGYGEMSPKSELSRGLAIFFIPLSVGVIGQGLAGVVNVFVEEEIKKANAKLMSRELTMEDLDNMNTDDDGEVSELEFIEFMLKTMKKVDKALLDDLHRQFRKMDADGSGSLQKADLELIAKRKIDVRRKLTLAAYKADVTKRGDTDTNILAVAHKRKKKNQIAAGN